MHDPFERRVQAAAVAGWWALLISIIALTLQWFLFRGVVTNPSHWIRSLWAPFDDAEVIHVTLWLVAVWKLCLWILTSVVLWLTLWARQLRKRASG